MSSGLVSQITPVTSWSPYAEKNKNLVQYHGQEAERQALYRQAEIVENIMISYRSHLTKDPNGHKDFFEAYKREHVNLHFDKFESEVSEIQRKTVLPSGKKRNGISNTLHFYLAQTDVLNEFLPYLCDPKRECYFNWKAFDSDGNTALMWALANGNNSPAMGLISSKVGGKRMLNLQCRSDDLSSKTSFNGNTALMIAAAKGHETLSCEGREGHDQLPLEYSNIEIMKALLNRQADPDLENTKSGNTPLHVAYARRNVEMVDILLDEGADPEFLNKKGQNLKSL